MSAPNRRWLSAAEQRLHGALLIPRVAWLGARTPRDAHTGWNQFWERVKTTGDGGDVLWDSSGDREIRQYANLVREHLDPTLPIVDVGCGNGRFTRLLADHFPRAIGVDLSPHAIAHAKRESGNSGNLSFIALDAALPGAGDTLRAEIGEANVFVRGVFHVLDVPLRKLMAANLKPLVGSAGRVLLTETNYRGSDLGYLRHLGASGRGIPMALQKAIVSLPRPGHFGATERTQAFPDSDWVLLDDGPTIIETVPMRNPVGAETIPGYFAILAAKQS